MYPYTHPTFFHKLFRHCALVVTLLMLTAGSVMAQTSISEIRIDQSGTDNDEYFELAGAPAASLDGLTYLVIGDGAGGSGTIEAVVGLSGQAIPGSGYFVAAEGTFTIGTADLTTSLNFENSDNVTHLLVSNFSGANGDDLDTDDDGTLDVTPWDAITDCVALIETVGSGEQVYCADGVGPDGTYVPGHAFECPGGWMIGAFSPLGQNDTPGAANGCGPVVPDAAISEVRIDQSGTDYDEYFELAGNPSDSLDGLTYLVIGDGAGSGSIEAVVDLTGQAIPGGGFFVAAEGTFTLGVADLTTSLNFENSDNVTHMLVWNFTGANGDDLDTNDDGALDVMPWDEVVDCIAMVETVGSGDLLYCATEVGPDGSYVPGHAFMCPGGWLIGAFSPVGQDDTPGVANDCAPAGPGLVINEIIQNPSAVSDSNGEWFELFNPTDATIDINGWIIADNDSDSHVITNGGPLEILPGGYLVLGTNADAGSNGNVSVDYSYGSGFYLGNGSDELVLTDDLANEVDRVEWDNGATFPDPSGASMSLLNPARDNNVGANWCTASTPFGDGDLGTPGAANDCAFPLINEVDADQNSTDTAEFVELSWRGDSAFSLDGLSLVFYNGSDDASYAAFDLDGYSIPAYGHFVLCGNAANVPNCDLDVSPDSNLIQNGADAVALVLGDAADYPNDTPVSTENLIDALVYDTGQPDDAGLLVLLNPGQPQVNDDTTYSMQRCPDGFGGARNTTPYIQYYPTPGGAALDCGTWEIFEIQGAGDASAYDSFTIRTMDNVVTAVGPNGFFMQTPPERSDGDVNTSDGIYVFTGAAPFVAVGDRVDVKAVVDEFFEFTQLVGPPMVSVISSGNTLPPPVVLNGAVPSPNPASPSCAIEYECYEGMLVEIANGVVTGGNQYFGSDPLAEVYISANGSRSYREPGLEYPGVGGTIPTWDTNPEVFELDLDKLGIANQPIYAGSTFNATGVIGFEYGGYELWPVTLNLTPSVLPVPVRSKMASETTIGSLNLYRPTEGDKDTRFAKLSIYIRETLLSPDILAVQEIASQPALQELADKIAADDPSVMYSAYLIEGNDVGGIDVGFLVRGDVVQVDAVMQLGVGEIFTYDGSLLHDRPPLLLEGKYTGNGFAFPLAVMVVHNRSLGGIETERVQLKRLAQAESIAAMVQSYQTANTFVPLSVVGDFNAFEFTDGYVDVVGHIKGMFNPAESLQSGLDLVNPNLTNQVDLLDAAQRYSFIYRGNAQVLDHALTNGAATFWARGMQFGRGNADAALLQLNHVGSAHRSSDHDGLVLFMMTDRDGDGSADDVDACPDNQYATVAHAEYGCDVTIPTLNPFGMLLMLLLLGGLGAYTVRYRSGF